MKTILNNLKTYFKRLYQAIFNITITENVRENATEGVIKEVTESVTEEPFNFDHIRTLIDMTNKNYEDNSQELLIANRKAINEHKHWYSRIVGYQKPPEPLKENIKKDLEVDRSEMNRKFISMWEDDFKKYKKERDSKRLESLVGKFNRTGLLSPKVREIMIVEETEGKSLEKIINSAKNHLDRMAKYE
tara:strand:+ start:4598 stop:5164 length:567 start_codon:yes stop_codon:yes gene_type:complete